MDTGLNITIRVASRQAQAQLSRIQRELSQIGTAMKGVQSSKWSPGLGAAQAAKREAELQQKTMRLRSMGRALSLKEERQYQQITMRLHAAGAKQKIVIAKKAAAGMKVAYAAAAREDRANTNRSTAEARAAAAAKTRAAADSARKQAGFSKLTYNMHKVSAAQVAKIEAASAAASNARRLTTAELEKVTFSIHKFAAKQRTAMQKAELAKQVADEKDAEREKREEARRTTQILGIEARERTARARIESNERIQLARIEERASRRASSAGALGGGFAAAIQGSKLINMGKNLNWVGRQLTYAFTIPLGLASAALFKFHQDNERAMTQVRKVYGTIDEQENSMGMLEEELKELSKIFELLSSRFGVAQNEVIDIAAAWAAAGSAGAGLAKNTRATMEVMILGSMDAATATEALIAIQDTWRFSTMAAEGEVSEMTTQLGYLNAIEDATAVSFADLVDITQRAGAVAMNSGTSFRELASMAAALVPSTGSAAQAGTSLRSMISSLMAPTDKATDALRLMGIEVNDPDWMGLDATARIERVAASFEGLSDAQKGVVGSILATKWQVSRFNQLMNDINSGTGRYAQAMDVTTDAVKTNDKYQRELLTVLESSPRAWDIMMQTMKNTMVKVFLPMIPAIMTLMNFVTQLTQAFADLDPDTQKWIMIGLLIIALVGPVMSLVGALKILTGVFTTTVRVFVWGSLKMLFVFTKVLITGMIRAIAALIPVIAGLGAPFWIIVGIIAAVAAIIVLILKTDIEDPIWRLMQSIGRAFAELPRIIAEAINVTLEFLSRAIPEIRKALADRFWETMASIQRAFAKLPEIVADSIIAVIRFLGRAMRQVVEWLSYLNPFARHSPSLVDNVRAGVSTILDEYSRLRGIGPMIAGASAALQRFSTATAGTGFREAELNEKVVSASKGSPQAGAAARNMADSILALESVLPALKREIDAQNQVVARWTAELKQADAAVAEVEKRLEGMEKALSTLGDQIDEAKDRISTLADTPIAGLTALEDQIFANELAQNKLNLELLEMERLGVTLDSISDKYAAMAGEIELLRGTQNELREAGAGSDILRVYEDQISAIEEQREELGESEDQIRDIQKQLDALDLEKRFMELTKAINFDPLERQIDKMVNGIDEMSFEDIIAQIKEQQDLIAVLQPQYDAMADAVEKEKLNLDAVTAKRDEIAALLDIEQEKASALESAYSDITGLINDMESAMNDYASAVEEAIKKVKELEQSNLEAAFEAGEGLDFEDVGGTAPALGREGGIKELKGITAALEQELADALAKMGDFDLLAPLKKMWYKVVEWFKGLGSRIWGLLQTAWEKVRDFFDKYAKEPFMKFVNWLKENWAKALGGAVLFIFGLPGLLIALIIGAVIKWGPVIWDLFYQYVLTPIALVFKTIGVEIWQWMYDNILDPIRDFFQKMWDHVYKFASENIIGPIYAAIAWGLGPIIDVVVKIWTIIFTVISTIMGIILTVISTGWGIIVEIFSWAWGKIKWVFDWLIDFFNRFLFPILELWYVLHLIFITLIVRLFEGMAAQFWWVWDNLLYPLWEKFKEVFEKVIIPAFEYLWKEAKAKFDWLAKILWSIWDQWLQPLWDGFLVVFEEGVIPAFNYLKDEVEAKFGAIAAILGWIWDHIIAPIWDKFGWAFEHVVKPAFVLLRDKVIGPLMDKVVFIIGTAWNVIAQIIESGVNMIIMLFNAVARAVSAVADFLHIDAEVNTIEHIKIDRVATGIDWGNLGGGTPQGIAPMATGGVTDRQGGIYNTPKAIIGEGSRSWPEYVIPTDPRYRANALRLLTSAGIRMMAAGGKTIGKISGGEISGNWNYTPQDFENWTNSPEAQIGDVGVGGGGGGGKSSQGGGSASWFDRAWAYVSNAAKWVGEQTIKALWIGPKAGFLAMADQLPFPMVKDVAHGIVDKIDQWINHIHTGMNEVAGRMALQVGGVGDTGSGAVGYAQGIPIIQGSGSWKSFVALLNKMGIPYTNLGTYVNKRTKYTNNVSWHALNRAMDFGAGSQMGLQRIDHALYDAFKPYLHELIWTGPNSRNVFGGQDHVFRSDIANDHRTHVHASMARGGLIVPRSMGGTNLTIGEGLYDEKVQVIPLHGGTDSEGGATINIYGDLEFPNIRSGDDAKELIANLKALAN